MSLDAYEHHPLMRQMRDAFGPPDQARDAFTRAVPQELVALLERLEDGDVMPWHLQSFTDELTAVLPPLVDRHLPMLEGMVATMLLHPQLPDLIGLTMEAVGQTTLDQCSESGFGAEVMELMVEVIGRHPHLYERIHRESEGIRERAPALGHRYRTLDYDGDEPLDVRLDALFETIGRLLEAGYKPYARFVGELVWEGHQPPRSPPRMLGQVVARASDGLQKNYPRFSALIDAELVQWRNHQSHDDRAFDRSTASLILGPGEWNLHCDEACLLSKLEEVDGLIGLEGGFQRALRALPYRLHGAALTHHVRETILKAQQQAERSELVAARDRFVSAIGNPRARRFLLGDGTEETD